MPRDEKEKLEFDGANPKTIPCLTCKWGLHNFLAEYCVKYELKPKTVYFGSQECEKYEPIK